MTVLDNNRADVVFVIDEGGRTGVKTISFVGNQAYSDRRLRRVISTRQSNWLSWLNRNDVYDPARIEADEELLRRFYTRNGYADFQVLSVDTTVDEEEPGNFTSSSPSKRVSATASATSRSTRRYPTSMSTIFIDW